MDRASWCRRPRVVRGGIESVTWSEGVAMGWFQKTRAQTWCVKGVVLRQGLRGRLQATYAAQRGIVAGSAEVKAFVDGKRAEMFGCFNKALGIWPDFAQGWLEMGAAYIDWAWTEYGDNRKTALECAERCFAKATDAESTNQAAWFQRGLALGSLSRPEEAIGCYDTCLAIDGTIPHAWRNKGEELQFVGRFQEAITCFVRASEFFERAGRDQDASECLKKANTLKLGGSYTT